MDVFGWVTIIDAAECNENINSFEAIHDFVNEVLDKIEMVKIEDLHINWCDTNDPMKVGISFYQLLQDSNISGHFCPEIKNSGYVDIFSCKPYDKNVVDEIFRKYFQPARMSVSFIERYIL